MKLGADNETLAENRVLILYIVSLLENPINNDSLYRLVLFPTISIRFTRKQLYNEL